MLISHCLIFQLKNKTFLWKRENELFIKKCSLKVYSSIKNSKSRLLGRGFKVQDHGLNGWNIYSSKVAKKHASLIKRSR